MRVCMVRIRFSVAGMRIAGHVRGSALRIAASIVSLHQFYAATPLCCSSVYALSCLHPNNAETRWDHVLPHFASSQLCNLRATVSGLRMKFNTQVPREGMRQRVPNRRS
jgi:hypothetical protein